MSESKPHWHGFALYLGIIGVWSLVAFVGLPQGDFANYWTASNLWWEGADLTRAYLVGANLNGANLAGADLTNTSLEKTNLKCLNHEICE